MNYVHFTATLDAAVWGAELASGDCRGRVYLVEPTGRFEDDPNVTDKRFPGNPTQSFRSRAPLRLEGEITDWVGHPAATLQAMRDKHRGAEAAGRSADRRLTGLPTQPHHPQVLDRDTPAHPCPSPQETHHQS